MLRFFNICLVLGLVALAYVIYEVKYEARGLDEDIAVLKKNIDAERDSVSVLRAEWSLLNRPERIERLAQKYLKLQPAKPDQLLALDTVSDADFQPARLAVAAAPRLSAGTAAKPELAKAKAPKAVAAASSGWTASVIPAPAQTQAATVQTAPLKPRIPVTASAAD